MRLMKFNVKAEYIPGKQMVVTEALSRNPQEIKEEKKMNFNIKWNNTLER